jgi:hypothetical protein
MQDAHELATGMTGSSKHGNGDRIAHQ